MPIRFADLCPRDLLMLVTRYHGVWIIVPAFTETPVIADVIVTFARSSTMSSSVDDGSHDDTAARALAVGAGAEF